MNIIYNRNSAISITSDILIGSGAASGHYDTYYTYDRMGNITSLTRIGLIGGAAYGIIDNLDCNYDGNRLTKVEDSAADADQPTYYGAFHFNDGADSDLEYAYDWNGNVTRDLNKGITEIKYNCLNLPSRITFSDGSTTVYTYSATGEKLGVRHVTANSNAYEAYCDNFIYRAGSLKRVLVDGGYITLSGGTKYHYYLKDHLGNNRMVVRADGTVEQVTHYYPYGGLMGESTGGDTQPYKYNGKELDRTNGLDWYDYGARHMDAALARFTTMDPMCEKYYDVSPYAYCGGNPITFVDPNGQIIKYFNSTDHRWYTYYNGNFYRSKDVEYNLKTNKVTITGKPVVVSNKSNDYMAKTLKYLNKMASSKDDIIREVISAAQDNANYEIRIQRNLGDKKRGSFTHGEYDYSTIYLDFEDDFKPGSEMIKNHGTEYDVFGHEFKHGYDYMYRLDYDTKYGKEDFTIDEFYTVQFENRIRKDEGNKYKRTSYGKVTVPNQYKKFLMYNRDNNQRYEIK